MKGDVEVEDHIDIDAPPDPLHGWRRGWSLPRRAYTDPACFAVDLERVWYREWVLAGVEAALDRPGAYERVSIGEHDLLLVRGDDGAIRALHNVCRHRGFRLCEEPTGAIRRRLVCPYHQWAYALDGALVKARSMPAELDRADLSLGTAHVRTLAGLVFVCLADETPDFDAFASRVGPYLAPYGLASARVAHRTVTVEQGNWKLVMENNRECFHCAGAHPELMRSFPEAPLHSGSASPEESAALDALVAACEARGLPSRYAAADDFQHRVMRMPFMPGVSSMTIAGTPAVARRFGGLPDGEVGDVLLYHYPSSWHHFQADHALVFRVEPVSVTESRVISYWLVPEAAREGVDYDLRTLTEVWEATNAQDGALVERAQRGIRSPAYRPGPYSPAEEDGVMQFIDWYASRVGRPG